MAPIDQKDKLNNISRLLSRQRLEKMRPEQSSDRTAGKDKSSAVVEMDMYSRPGALKSMPLKSESTSCRK